VHDDLERLVVGEFPRPTDDEFLGVLVEVALGKRKRIERVEELRNVADANLDRPVGSADARPVLDALAESRKR